MRNRLFPALAVLSLALSVLLCGLWVRSHWWADTINFNETAGRVWMGTTDRGGVSVGWMTGLPNSAPPKLHWAGRQHAGLQRWDAAASAKMMGGSGTSAIGFGVGAWDAGPGSGGSKQAGRFAQFPLWFPTLLTIIPPILWLRRWRKQRGMGFPVEVGAGVGGRSGPSSQS